MSLATLKKKTTNLYYGTKISAKPPGAYWLSQGPFGANATPFSVGTVPFGKVGFSLNGTIRSRSYIGKSYHMSTNGTPFHGIYPQKTQLIPGVFSEYPDYQYVPSFNNIAVTGIDYLYNKPTVLTTYGMLRKKFRWAYNGTYPNYWVKGNVNTGNLTDNSSQQVYIDKLKAKTQLRPDTNSEAKFVDYYKNKGVNCHNNNSIAAGYTYNLQTENGGTYTKTLHVPISSSDYTTLVQKRCAGPYKYQKHYPEGTNGGRCTSDSANNNPNTFIQVQNKIDSERAQFLIDLNNIIKKNSKKLTNVEDIIEAAGNLC
jgi:hypothetical protein